MKYKLSKYSHIYPKGSDLMVYHALRMVVNNISGSMYDEANHSISTDDTALVNILSQCHIIIDSPDVDVEDLQKCRQEISKPYISTAYFFLTKNCNLGCKYCFERQSETENTQDGGMSHDVMISGLDFFQRLINLDKSRLSQKKTIIFYGGEPFHNKRLLHAAIEEIRRRIDSGSLPKSTKMLVVTNGTLITDDDIRFLKENEVTVTFSLDGDEKASVNRVYVGTDKLAWHKATETFKKCVAAGLDLNIACTLPPETISRQDEVLNYFIGIGARNIGFNVILDNDIVKLGEDYDDRAAEFVTTSYHILDRHGITENRTGRRLNVFAGKHPCLFDCNACGGRQIAIAPNGRVGICHEHIMDQKHFITDIYDKSFDPSESPEYQMWNYRSPLYMPECQDCIAIGICGGGCAINSERGYGTINRPDPRFCKQTLSILKNILL